MFDVGELLSSMSRQQLEDFWCSLGRKCASALMHLDDVEDDVVSVALCVLLHVFIAFWATRCRHRLAVFLLETDDEASRTFRDLQYAILSVQLAVHFAVLGEVWCQWWWLEWLIFMMVVCQTVLSRYYSCLGRLFLCLVQRSPVNEFQAKAGCVRVFLLIF